MNTEVRHGRKFGDNQLVRGDSDIFFKLPAEIQAAAAAWSEGCPVKNKVVNRKGPEEARLRYHNVIIARLWILSTAKDLNPDLHTQLTQSLTREKGEPVGVYEPVNAPASIKDTIVANNTPWGYALPRMIVDFMSPDDEQTPDQVKERSSQMMAILKSSVESSRTPIEFMARFAKLMVVVGVDPKTILKTMLSAGYLEENNTYKLFQELKGQLQQVAPTLFYYYQSLSSQEKAEAKIADI